MSGDVQATDVAPLCDDCDLPRQHAPGCMVGDLTTVKNGAEFQGLTLWLGDRLPVHVDDFMAGADLRDLIVNPTARAVAVARLRSVADLLAAPTGEADHG